MHDCRVTGAGLEIAGTLSRPSPFEALRAIVGPLVEAAPEADLDRLLDGRPCIPDDELESHDQRLQRLTGEGTETDEQWQLLREP